jgi:hypothetical protein
MGLSFSSPGPLEVELGKTEKACRFEPASSLGVSAVEKMVLGKIFALAGAEVRAGTGVPGRAANEEN